MPEEQEELTVSKLRMLFVDILNGFSVIKQKSDDIYVKHLTFYDAADVDTFKREHEKIAEEKGLESEKVKLAELKKQELWDDKKEARIEELKGYVKNLTYSKSKLFLKREIDQISKQIKESEEELHSLTLKKVELLGLEGLRQADWVLLDANDVIVHLFRPEVREFYGLERMWSDDAATETVKVGGDA